LGGGGGGGWGGGGGGLGLGAGGLGVVGGGNDHVLLGLRLWGTDHGLGVGVLGR